MKTEPDVLLLIDDNRTNRALATNYLLRLGWKVVSCENASDALTWLSRSLPGAMLVDIRLPGMQGDELVAQIRAAHPNLALRIVAYTAHCMPDEISRFRECGFDDVLVKPVSFAQMRSVLPTPTMLSPPPPPAAPGHPDSP